MRRKSPLRPPEKEFDVFICHAGEDKKSIAKPLAVTLRDYGIKVWYDEFTLSPGDSLRRSIEKGLASSRFGVVILSPSFFAKGWPEYELSGLTAKEIGGHKTIIPICTMLIEKRSWSTARRLLTNLPSRRTRPALTRSLSC